MPKVPRFFMCVHQIHKVQWSNPKIREVSRNFVFKVIKVMKKSYISILFILSFVLTSCEESYNTTSSPINNTTSSPINNSNPSFTGRQAYFAECSHCRCRHYTPKSSADSDCIVCEQLGCDGRKHGHIKRYY